MSSMRTNLQSEAEERQPILQGDGSFVGAHVFSEPTEWSTGLCECCAQPGGGAVAWVSLSMPFVQFGVLAEQLPKGSVPLAGGFCGASCAYFWLDVLSAVLHTLVFPGVSVIPISACLHVQLRSHLRRKYNIKGTSCNDFCTAWWCGPCAIAQETREYLIRSAAAQGAGAGPSGALPAGQPQRFGYMFLPAASYTPPAQADPMAFPGSSVPMATATATGVPVTGLPAAGKQ